jgi:3-methyl-2-oxobutanoate hydroxymethyltransferase
MPDTITIPKLQAKKRRGEKLTMLTCYDATFARILDAAPIDMLLVGDSLGMVIQGEANTIPVTLEDILYHTRCVTRGVQRAHVVADMPFMSYQPSTEMALVNAGRLMKEGHAHAIKMEGGEELVPTVASMTAHGIPVMVHIGLRPQTVHQMGGYRVQGKSAHAGEQLVKEARLFEEAGAYALILEGITIEVAADITAKVRIPTIGINAGPECDGQVLVLYDLLGLDTYWAPRFVKQYANLAVTVKDAVTQYADEVRSGQFPTEANALHQHSVQRREGKASA